MFLRKRFAADDVVPSYLLPPVATAVRFSADSCTAAAIVASGADGTGRAPARDHATEQAPAAPLLVSAA